jgi:hypothetical protein
MVRSDFLSRSTFAAIVAAYGLIFGPVGCAPVETAVVAEPGTSFTLPVGKTAAVKGTDTRLTFREVREDSRCPTDVTCVWAGDAKIAVVISRYGVPDETRIMSITPPNNETRSDNLRIRFVSLAPVPRQADANTPRSYVAQFIVDNV